MGKTILRCIKCKKDFQSSNWDERHCPDCRVGLDLVKLPEEPVEIGKVEAEQAAGNIPENIPNSDIVVKAKDVGVKKCSRCKTRPRAKYSFSYCKECHAERVRLKYKAKKGVVK